MSTASTDLDEGGFTQAATAEIRGVDVAAVVAVPVVLVAVFALPLGVREQFVFESAAPTIRTAYLSHFVHRQQLHLFGNLAVYLVVAPVTYLLCVLAGRRLLFRATFVTLLTVFPFALSVMQLLFPRQREILGFSGLNAGLFGLLCVAWVVYVSKQFLSSESTQYAPALLFLICGVIALLTLPARAWRLEIGLGSVALGIGYLLLWVRSDQPDGARIRRGLNRPGYAELAGAGLGLIVSYPFVGFRDIVTVGTSVIDVYIHLLGFALAFIVVYVYLIVVE
ncbi:hypothetical protein [Halovenus halobia]|uniref:hypothetical protein n=1 Tax=Halovenus halobia TaxID=3396622 RepID=UPI003F56AF8D